MENIISIEEFDPKNIVLNNPTKNTHGGTVIPVHYQCPRRGKIPFIIKLPRCDLPYGVSQFPTADKVEKGKESSVNYSLNISFTGFDDKFKNNPQIGMFFDKWKKMEKHIHKQLVAGSQKYLKDDVDSVKVMEKMCWPIVKHSKDKDTGKITNKYPPTFSIKLPRYGKEGVEPKFNTKVFDHNNKEVTLTTDNVYETFPRYSEIKGLIQCSSLQRVAKLSMSFRAVQVKTYPGKNQIAGNAFAGDSDDEDSNQAPAKAAVAEDSEDNAAANAAEADGSGDESSEAEVEGDDESESDE